MRTILQWQSEVQHVEWLPIFVARLTVGTLFAISGSRKLFVPKRRAQMLLTLREAAIPFPEANALFVSAVECICGSLLIVGFVTPLDCLLLSGDMAVALWTSILPRVKASSLTDWLEAVLYLPETLYLIVLCWLLVSGPGWLSVDAMLNVR